MKQMVFGAFLTAVVLLLSGCLYNDDSTKQNPYEDQLEDVQEAIMEFREDENGILPIKNKDADTDIYLKYLVDFKRLVPKYLPDIPPSAFENGGKYQYLIINAEENPTVKVFDLTIAEKIRDINFRISTRDYPPFKEQMTKNIYSLDFKKLGYDEEPFVVSPYTGHNLPFVIDTQGEVYVDYASDLYLELQKRSQIDFEPGEDIRYILSDESHFVPAYSLPYTVDDKGEVIFIDEK